MKAIDVMSGICTSGAILSTVQANLASYEAVVKDTDMPLEDSTVILAMLAIAAGSCTYWQNVINSVGSTPWDPWLTQYSPLYDTAAPNWVNADFIGFSEGLADWVAGHVGEKFDHKAAFGYAGYYSTLFSTVSMFFNANLILVCRHCT